MTDTTRRTAMGSIAAGLAGIAAAATASAAPGANPDAGIIRASAELVACLKAIEDMFPRRRTLEEEHETDDEFRALYQRLSAVQRRLEDLGGPRSPAGAVALSRAALATAHRDRDNDIICENFAEWAAFTVAQWVEEHAGAGT